MRWLGYGMLVWAAACRAATPAGAPNDAAPNSASDSVSPVPGERGYQAPPCDADRARRAARSTFARAKAEGLLSAEVERDCDPEAARCAPLPPPDGLPPERCDVTLREFVVVIEPALGRNSLRAIEAWVDEAAAVDVLHAHASTASRFGSGSNPIVVAGKSRFLEHTRGSDVPQVGSATFDVRNPGADPVMVRVVDAEFLTGADGELPSTVTAHPGSIEVTPVHIPPGDTELTVSFATLTLDQPADLRFAARITFEIDGARAPVTVEYSVSQTDPS